MGPRPVPGLTVRFLPWALLLALPRASAHGVGGSLEARFVLPQWVVWLTGALVVAVSFVVVGGFLTSTRPPRVAPTGGAEEGPPPPRIVTRPLQLVGLLALALLAVHAFLPGSGGALPEALVWFGLWSALPMTAYLWRNPWEVVNPLRAIGDLADRLRGERPPRAYPPHWGTWPATVLLIGLIGLEVWDGPGALGTGLARIVVGYAAFTFVAAYAFGGATWLSKGEGFTRFFRTWRAFSPRRPGGAGWRGPGAGIVERSESEPGSVAFLVALLYGVNFDGFLATGVGASASAAVATVAGPGLAHVAILLAGYGLFLAAFWACVYFIRKASESLEPPGDIAARFAGALLPIAVGYHLAHNLFLVVEQAPVVLTSLADPLALGWVPTAEAYTFPAAYAAWFGGLQMAFILAGHVIAVVVAHHQAVLGFPSRIQALRSEVPLTAVMSFYTLVGLWIVSQGAHDATGMVGA